MKKLFFLLRSRRGDLLVDGMVGAAVAGLIVTATVSLLIILGQTGVANSNNAAREILINSVLSEKLPEQDRLTTTPEISTYPVMESTAEVAVWREKELKDGNPTGTSILYARTARHGSTNPAECRTADKNNPGSCMIARMRLNDDVGGMNLNKYPLIPNTGTVTGATPMLITGAPVPAGVKEVRYVFRVTEASATSKVRFYGAGRFFDVTIPAGQTGFYYGSVLLPGTVSTNISISYIIAAGDILTFDDTSFLLYGAPQ